MGVGLLRHGDESTHGGLDLCIRWGPRPGDAQAPVLGGQQYGGAGALRGAAVELPGGEGGFQERHVGLDLVSANGALHDDDLRVGADHPCQHLVGRVVAGVGPHGALAGLHVEEAPAVERNGGAPRSGGARRGAGVEAEEDHGWQRAGSTRGGQTARSSHAAASLCSGPYPPTSTPVRCANSAVNIASVQAIHASWEAASAGKA